MHILLTDILACPRCGPEAGLILLSHDTRDRRVLDGWLGCSSCRARWEVRAGFGEFRAPLGEEPAPEGADSPAAGTHASADAAVRIAALLGVTEGPAWLLVTGPAARRAADVAALIDDVEIVAADPELAAETEEPGVNRIALGDRLPFYTGRLHGVWLGGASADTLLEEGARALRPLGRLVLEPAPHDADTRLAAAGLRILARKDDTLVATRSM